MPSILASNKNTQSTIALIDLIGLTDLDHDMDIASLYAELGPMGISGVITLQKVSGT